MIYTYWDLIVGAVLLGPLLQAVARVGVEKRYVSLTRHWHEALISYSLLLGLIGLGLLVQGFFKSWLLWHAGGFLALAVIGIVTWMYSGRHRG